MSRERQDSAKQQLEDAYLVAHELRDLSDRLVIVTEQAAQALGISIRRNERDDHA